MKSYQVILGVLLLGYICNAQTNKTIIKGQVKDWPTDSTYLQTMPFHSPHSSELYAKIISKKGTFSFDFEDIKAPFVVQIFATKELANFNKEELLYNNLTEDYYIRQCVKFYTYGKVTLLIEPNKTLEIDLTYNTSLTTLKPEDVEKHIKIGAKVSKKNTIINDSQMSINFKGGDIFQNEYYQKSFELDKMVDRRLEIYKDMPLDNAILGYQKITQKLLNDLEAKKERLSLTFYNYIKAEIEFGAKYQFLRFLMLDKNNEMDTFFSKGIPKDILDVLSFDKTKVNKTIMVSEEFNNFIEMYLNFKLSEKNKKLILNDGFGFHKIRIAIRNLPKASVYYYLANNLLQTNREKLMKVIKSEEAVEELITKTITKYPNGELNDKLMVKYNL
ncbi:hypothetical protein Q4Q35_05660 [Flavivirga aquimarina]|uniref:DUF4369 domain-containing protein n=1 Tax=Flavivirga aquimarina TaxID=2027862 RepID=A0ABT8W851_9FLAO|nr:hypothetical protein [Flavivirga aquimarina]MDO5969288.1 hypothetical protein [Flavivirga aquimarina]